MTQLLDFCSKCGARRLRDIKKKLQDLFASRGDLEENVCWICQKVIGRRRGRKKKAAEETTITWELKTEPADVPVGQETLQTIRNLESDNVPGETETLQANSNLQSDNVPAETDTLQANWNLESDDDFAEPMEANNDEDSEGPLEVKMELLETEMVVDNSGDADIAYVSAGAKQDENHDKNERKRRPRSSVSEVKTENNITEDKAVFETQQTVNVPRRTTRLKIGAIKAKTVTSFDKQVYGLESDDDVDDDFSDKGEARDDDVWDPESEELDKDVGKHKKDKTSGLEEKVKAATAADMALLLASVYNKPEKTYKETETDAPSSSKNQDGEPTRAYLELKALRQEVLEVLGKFEDEEIPYQCKFCKHKPYRTAVPLMKHVAEKHKATEPITKPFLCKTSGKYFETSREWYRHTKEKPYKCKHSGCNSSFTDKHNLHCHYLGCHDEARPFPCKQCDSSFKFKNALMKHVKTVHDQIKDHVCRFCGQAFTTAGTLKRHEQGHTNDRPFKCHQCGKAYITKVLLKGHLMDHTGERPYVCETCGYRAKDKSSLKVHLQIHEPTDISWKCDMCGKQFKRRRHLRVHTCKSQVHEERYKCRFCEKKFSYKTTCDIHEKGHPEWSGERKFICKICGRDCHTKLKLAEHMRSHTKEKSFHCTHCSYSTSLKRNLDTHMRQHTGDKPYRCPTCDMRFMYYQPCKDHQNVCNQATGASGRSSRVQAGNSSSGGQASSSSSGQVEIKSEITEALPAESKSANGQSVVTQVLPSIPNIGGQDYMLL